MGVFKICICLSFLRVGQSTLPSFKYHLKSIIAREITCCKLFSVSIFQRRKYLIIFFQGHSLHFCFAQRTVEIFQEPVISLSFANGNNACRGRGKMEMCERIQILPWIEGSLSFSWATVYFTSYLVFFNMLVYGGTYHMLFLISGMFKNNNKTNCPQFANL